MSVMGSRTLLAAMITAVAAAVAAGFAVVGSPAMQREHRLDDKRSKTSQTYSWRLRLTVTPTAGYLVRSMSLVAADARAIRSPRSRTHTWCSVTIVFNCAPFSSSVLAIGRVLASRRRPTLFHHGDAQKQMH